MVERLLQGLALGWIIVLPGMSGGTVFIILGIYEELLRDIAALKLRSYWPMFCGAAAGIFLGGTVFAILIAAFRDLTTAFLLGLLLASIKAVFTHRMAFTPGRMLIMFTGLLVGCFLAGEPVGVVEAGEQAHPLLLTTGGALSSAAMFIPGVPGSSLLIVMGIYDEILFYVRDLFLPGLLPFGAGALVGIFLLARVLEKFYVLYRAPLSYFFAGLIGGSSRALWPEAWSPFSFLLFAAGFYIVWRWGGGKAKEDAEVILNS